MKIKFNKFERVAGLFVMAAIVGSLVATAGVGIKRGWFTRKIPLYATLPSADGVFVGTQVQMSGLRAGSVDEVELTADNQVRIKFLVKEEIFKRLHGDSAIQIVRPFIIGEKIIEVLPGDNNAALLKAEAYLPVRESMDIMDMLSGRKLGAHLSVIGKLSDNLRLFAEAFADPARTKALIEVIDEIHPLVTNMGEMSKQVVTLTKKINRTEDLEKVLSNARVLTAELNKIVPELNHESPHLGKDVAQMATNLTVLTAEFSKMVPLMQQMAPQLPHASERALEALDETVVTLKAIQRSFFLRGSTREVREEEAKREKEREKVRAPSNADD